MELPYDNRIMVSVANTANGDVGGDTVFHYHQQESVVWATYEGGRVRYGTLVAVVAADGSLDMRYQHVTVDGDLATGICRSVPEILPDGRLRLRESWRWTSGDRSAGESIVEERLPGRAS